MDYHGAVEQIKKGNIAPVYLIHGEESFLGQKLEKLIVDQLLSADEKDTNLFTFDNDPDSRNLANTIESIPFLGGKNVVIIRETKLFRAQQKDENVENDEAEGANVNEHLVNLLSSMPEYSHLLFFTSQKIDKRRKIYKIIDKYGAVIPVEPLKAKEVRSWLQSKLQELHKKMSQDAMEYIVTAISFMPQISISFLDNEMEKAALYVGRRVIIEYEDLQDILSPIPEVSIFALIDAMSQKQLSLSLKLLREQIADGEHPLKIIALLSRQVRLLYQVKESTGKGLTPRQIAETLKLHPFVAEKLQKQSRGFAVAKLQQALVSLAQIDWGLKSGRTGADGLENFIMNMCK